MHTTTPCLLLYCRCKHLQILLHHRAYQTIPMIPFLRLLLPSSPRRGRGRRRQWLHHQPHLICFRHRRSSTRLQQHLYIKLLSVKSNHSLLQKVWNSSGKSIPISSNSLWTRMHCRRHGTILVILLHVRLYQSMDSTNRSITSEASSA